MENVGKLSTSRSDIADLRDASGYGPVWSLERATLGFWSGLLSTCTGSDGNGYKLAADAKNITHDEVANITARGAISAVHGDVVLVTGDQDYRWDESLSTPAWVAWNGTDVIAPYAGLDPTTEVSSWKDARYANLARIDLAYVFLEDYDKNAGTYTYNAETPDLTASYDDEALALAYADAIANSKILFFLGKEYVFKDPVLFGDNGIKVCGVGKRTRNTVIGTRLTSIMQTGTAFGTDGIGAIVESLTLEAYTSDTGVNNEAVQFSKWNQVHVSVHNPTTGFRAGRSYTNAYIDIDIINEEMVKDDDTTYLGVGFWHDTLTEATAGGNMIMQNVIARGFEHGIQLGQETTTISGDNSWRRNSTYSEVQGQYNKKNLVVGSGYRNIKFDGAWLENASVCDIWVMGGADNLCFDTAHSGSLGGINNIVLGHDDPAKNVEIGSMTFTRLSVRCTQASIRIHPVTHRPKYPYAVHKFEYPHFIGAGGRCIVSDRVDGQTPVRISHPSLSAGPPDDVPRLGYDSTTFVFGSMVPYNDYIEYEGVSTDYNVESALTEAEQMDWWLAPQDAAATWPNRGTVVGDGTLHNSPVITTTGQFTEIDTTSTGNDEIYVSLPVQPFDFTETGVCFFAMSFKWNGETLSSGTGPRFFRGIASGQGIDFYLANSIPRIITGDGTNTLNLTGEGTLATGVDYVACLSYTGRKIRVNVYDASGDVAAWLTVDMSTIGDFTPAANGSISGYANNWIEGEIGDIIINKSLPADEKSLARAMALRASAAYSYHRKAYEYIKAQ